MSEKPRLRWLVAVLVVSLVFGTGASAQQRSLDDVEERLDQIANEIEQAEVEAGSAEAELEDAEERLAEVEAIVNEIAREIDLQEERVARAQAELERLVEEAARVEEAVQGRIIEMFKGTHRSDIELVLASGDVAEALDRQALLSHVNRSEQATIEGLEAAQGAVQTQQEILEGEQLQLEQQHEEQQRVLAQVEEIRNSKAVAEAAARARVLELAREEEDLEAEQEEIERLIELASQANYNGTIGVPPGSNPGGYQWPMCGQVTSGFGYRWGRLHAGLDIVSGSGQIFAARSGTVAHAAWQGGYGNLTLIDHGGGQVTAYAHQSSFAVGVGQQVAQGQYIGQMGSTGNSTGPHLHFEIRIGGSAQNPRHYLPGGC